MKKITVLFLAMLCLQLPAKSVSVTSPGGKNVLVTDGTSYSIFHNGQCLVKDAALSLSTDGAQAGKVLRIKAGKTVSEHITAPLYRQKEFDYVYNPLTVEYKGDFSVQWRVSDEGVAYRHIYKGKAPLVIKDEEVRLPFPTAGKAWIPYSRNKEKPFAMSFESLYTVAPLSEAEDQPAFLPLTVEAARGVKLTILESDLRAYPGLFIEAEGNTLKGVFARYPSKFEKYPWRDMTYVAEREDFIARCDGERTFPWRIFAITENDTCMPVNNLVYALAEPSRVEDVSWIKPGFSAWEWWNDWNLTGVDFVAGINDATYRHYIDFASENGLEYLIFDEGWYPTREGDILNPIPSLHLEELVPYAASKNVKIILWCVFNTLDGKLEEAMDKYSAMGVAGFKVDFLDRDDQTAVEMVYRIAESAARHRMVLDLHGIYKPTGINRTFPNILNFEGIYGGENHKWNEADVDMPLFDVTFPFIRQMTGFSDYTPGAMHNSTKETFAALYRNPMSMGTRAHQVALYIVVDAPLAMLCDSPSHYRKEQETASFIASLPRIWDETLVTDGKIGEYIVTARRSEGTWCVAGMTSWEPRDLEIDLSFLPEGEWNCSIFRDGPNASHNAADYKIDNIKVDSLSRPGVHLAPGGGFCMIITKNN